jgi:plastocyanin
MKSVILSIAMGATLAQAITHVVNLGWNGNLFTPDQIVANVGDRVQFEFLSNVCYSLLHKTAKEETYVLIFIESLRRASLIRISLRANRA